MIIMLIIICIFILLLVGLIIFFSLKFPDSEIFQEPKPQKINVFASIYDDEIKLINETILDQYFDGAIYKNTSFFEDCCVDVYTYISSKRYADEDGHIKDFKLADSEGLLTAELIKEYNRRFANFFSPGFDFAKVISVDLRTVKGRILVKRMFL